MSNAGSKRLALLQMFGSPFISGNFLLIVTGTSKAFLSAVYWGSLTLYSRIGRGSILYVVGLVLCSVYCGVSFPLSILVFVGKHWILGSMHGVYERWYKLFINFLRRYTASKTQG